MSLAPQPRASVSESGIGAKDLLARLDKRDRTLRSLRALAEMRYKGPADSLHTNQVVVVERPKRFRIEVISAFGLSLQLTSDSQTLRAYYRGDQTYYHGRANPKNLQRFTRLDLDVAEITDVLAGLPPKEKRRGRAAVAFEKPTSLWRVTASLTSGGTQIVWFDQEGLLPVRTEVTAKDAETLYDVVFGDYRQVDSVRVPHRIEIRIPSQDVTLELRYSSVTVNGDFSAELFRFDAPSGANVVDLDEIEDS